MSPRVGMERKQSAPIRLSHRKDDVGVLCEEITKDMNVTLTPTALEILRDGSKAFVAKVKEDAKLVAAHCGRDEVTDKDMELVLRLRET